MAVSHISQSCLEECTRLLSDCVLRRFEEGNDRPLDSSDFEELRDKIQGSAEEVYNLIKLEEPSDSELNVSPSESDEFSLLLLIHCSENLKDSHWTSDETKRICQLTFKLVFGSEEACQSLLLEDHGKLLKKLLLELRPFLLSGTWKQYPTAVQSFVWCLKLLEAPYLGHYLDALLPTALIITDDFTIENKIVGIKCIHHIISNVALTDLRIRSHDEVIYKTLETCISQRDPDLVPVFVSCLISLLKKMYFLSTDHYSKWTHYDEVMTKYLYQLKLESNVVVRKAMLESLIKLISTCRLISVRYLGNIIEIVDESSVNQSTVLPALKVIYEILAICNPCIEHHLKQITFIVLKILYSSESYKPYTVEEVKDACKTVLIRIHLTKSSLLFELISAHQFNELNPDIRLMIEEVVM